MYPVFGDLAILLFPRHWLPIEMKENRELVLAQAVPYQSRSMRLIIGFARRTTHAFYDPSHNIPSILKVMRDRGVATRR